MTVMISLTEDLAERLRAQAQARHLSIEEWALTILVNASERPDHPETWTEANDRRLALIRKRFGVGLSERQQKEFQALQDVAAKVFEPVDRRRLKHLRSLVREATEPADE